MHWLGPITFMQANMHEYFNNTHTLVYTKACSIWDIILIPTKVKIHRRVRNGARHAIDVAGTDGSAVLPFKLFVGYDKFSLCPRPGRARVMLNGRSLVDAQSMSKRWLWQQEDIQRWLMSNCFSGLWRTPCCNSEVSLGNMWTRWPLERPARAKRKSQ